MPQRSLEALLATLPPSLRSVLTEDSSPAALRDHLIEAFDDQRALHATVSDGVWDWWIQEDFEYLSPSFWTLLGYEPDSMGHSPSARRALIHPDDVGRAANALANHVDSRGQVPIDYELKYRHRAGHWLVLRCRARVIRWAPSGAALRLVGTFTDLSELRANRTQIELAYKGSGLGLWDWIDTRSQHVYWSPEFLQLLGYDPETEMEAATHIGQIYPEDRERTLAALKAHQEHNVPYRVSYRVQCKSGEYRWFEAQGESYRDAQGKPLRMVGFIRDIHERKLEQNALEDLKNRHELALDASQIGIWDLDLATNQLLWDRQMFALYDEPRQVGQVPFEEWLERLFEADRAPFQTLLGEALQHHRSFSTEFRVRHKDGHLHHLCTMATVQRDEDGTPCRVLGASWDVTVDRQRQAELQRSNGELAEFAYMASHDLRSPVRSMGAVIDWIAEDLNDGQLDAIGEHLELLRRRLARMDGLIDGILAYTRAERGGTSERVQLQSLIYDVFEAMSSILKDHQLEVLCPPIEFETDAARLRQVLTALVENAALHQDRPSGQILVEVQEQADALLVRVCDDGPGIPPEFHEKVFGLFRTLKSRNQGGGAGIGLSLAKKNVELQGGTIRIDTPAPRGCCVEFFWPLVWRRQPTP